MILPASSVLLAGGGSFIWAILPSGSLGESRPGRAEGLPLMRTLDNRSSYAAIGLPSLSSLLLRILYALSQRQALEVKFTMMFATSSLVAFWDISPAALAPFFGVVDGAVSKWARDVLLVDEVVRSERETAFARACQ